ncbi:MAG: hypothetical protein LBR48_03705 [Dysgonamonadaceae bacterium]|jgi:hypothetical protein|nr:hypothetical protein [Dysgonamonadaceae bacterium]
MWNLKIKNSIWRLVVSAAILLLFLLALFVILNLFRKENCFWSRILQEFIQIWIPVTFLAYYRKIFIDKIGFRRKSMFVVIALGVIYISIASGLLTLLFDRPIWKVLIEDLFVVLFSVLVLVLPYSWGELKKNKK